MTRFCIYGTGAIGATIGGKLLQAGYDVDFIARGAQLQALRSSGLTLRSGQTIWQGPVNASDDPQQLATPDYVFITTKSYSVPQIAPQIGNMAHNGAVIIPALNGIPWWYFYSHPSNLRGHQLRSLDPDGSISQHIPPEQLIGCVVYLAGKLVQPGLVEYNPGAGPSLIIGEPDNSESLRLRTLTQHLSHAGFHPVQTQDIRSAIWHKLWGNIAFNPISALTHGTMDQIVEAYHDTDLLLAVMNEARHIAEKIGITFPESPLTRLKAVAEWRGHKTSMLQDMEMGRPTEIEAIVGAVREIGLALEESMPYLNSLYSLVKLKERFYQPQAAPANRPN